MPNLIKVKYFIDDPMFELSKIQKGDFIDLRSRETFEYKQGDFIQIPLGVAMELPRGYEAHVVPRSSTFKNFGIIMVNSMGVIDNSYCGDNDEWSFPALAMKDGKIEKGDRICQFRMMANMGQVKIETHKHLGNPDRGGFGTTGRK